MSTGATIVIHKLLPLPLFDMSLQVYDLSRSYCTICNNRVRRAAVVPATTNNTVHVCVYSIHTAQCKALTDKYHKLQYATTLAAAAASKYWLTSEGHCLLS
jgi:hypothetical protein